MHHSYHYVFFNHTAPTQIYTLSLHDALPILRHHRHREQPQRAAPRVTAADHGLAAVLGHRHARRRVRSEEHTSELQSRQYLVCRLLLEKKERERRHDMPVAHKTVVGESDAKT